MLGAHASAYWQNLDLFANKNNLEFCVSEHLDQGKFKSQLFAQKFESDFELSFWLDLKNLKKFVKKIFLKAKFFGKRNSNICPDFWTV